MRDLRRHVLRDQRPARRELRGHERVDGHSRVGIAGADRIRSRGKADRVPRRQDNARVHLGECRLGAAIVELEWRQESNTHSPIGRQLAEQSDVRAVCDRVPLEGRAAEFCARWDSEIRERHHGRPGRRDLGGEVDSLNQLDRRSADDGTAAHRPFAVDLVGNVGLDVQRRERRFLGEEASGEAIGPLRGESVRHVHAETV